MSVDLLYGAAGDDAAKHGARAQELSMRAASSRYSKLIKIHKDSITSHTKFLIADDGMGSYLAILGSCNWLSTPFNAVEFSYIIVLFIGSNIPSNSPCSRGSNSYSGNYMPLQKGDVKQTL